MSDEAIANATFVEVDNGQFKIRPTTTARIVVDVFGCFTTTSSGGKQLALHSSPVNRGTHTLSNTGSVDVVMGGGSNSVALTVADVTSTNTNKAWLWAYKPTVAVPSTSNINLVPGDGISNMMLTPTAYVSSADRIRIKRSTTTTGTISLNVLQVGYFY